MTSGDALTTLVASTHSMTVETYYCLWAAGSNNNVFVVEVTDPKDNLR